MTELVTLVGWFTYLDELARWMERSEPALTSVCAAGDRARGRPGTAPVIRCG